MLLKSREATRLNPIAYDKLLSAGWFRGARFMNKPEYICVEEDIYSPVHIRLNIKDFSFKKTHRKVLKKVEERFRVEVSKSSLCEEAELLYLQNKLNFQAFIYPSLEDAIHIMDSDSTFQTLSIKVFDQEKLVAISYFDIGHESIASLIGLYDRSYTGFSLGTYTILKEIEWCMNNQYSYYYPGYVLDDMKIFGYKLQFGQYEFKDGRGQWRSQEKYNRESSKAIHYKKHFDQLVGWLKENQLQGRTKVYPLHYAYNPQLNPKQFYKYPMFYEMIINGERHAASYDPEKKTFVWSQIKKSGWHARLLSGLEFSQDLQEGKNYEMNLLECVREIHLPIQLMSQLQISMSTPTGQWSDPITSFKMKASFK